MIYRKGKNHRVLVCPRCGVLATNGLLKTGLDIATDFVPYGGLVKKGLSAVGLNPLDEKEKTSRMASSSSTDRFTTEERVALALR